MSDKVPGNRRLIQVHSEKPHYICCSCCDETSEVDSTIWYKELQDNEKYFEFQTFLECCKDKVGTVVGWCNLEDYEKTTGYENQYGIRIRKIAGYKEN